MRQSLPGDAGRQQKIGVQCEVLFGGMIFAIRCKNDFGVVMQSIQQDIAGLSQAMNLRTYRHQVLASNVANADTPQYKARDFDFQRAMQQAAGGMDGALGLNGTDARHLGNAGGLSAPGLQFRTETQSAVDGNTVDMDVERAQIAENAFHYQVLSMLITDRFKGMRSALSGTQG